MRRPQYGIVHVILAIVLAVPPIGLRPQIVVAYPEIRTTATQAATDTELPTEDITLPPTPQFAEDEVEPTDESAPHMWPAFRDIGIVDPVSPEEAERLLAERHRQRAPLLANSPGALASTEAEVTPELTALATALGGTPAALFRFVRNEIEFTPIFGSINGATGAYWAGTGGDCDQASLLIALLRAAGHTASYGIGTVRYDLPTVARWLGVANNAPLVQYVLAAAGIPFTMNSAKTTVDMTRFWVVAQVGGQTVWFDPAMKEYQTIQGIDLVPIVGYDWNALYNRASAGSEWMLFGIRNVNEPNVRADMTAMSMRLVNHIRTQMPDASLQDIIGGRRIVPVAQIPDGATLPYATTVTNVQVVADLPNMYWATWRVRHAGLDYTLPLHQVRGRRLTITYRAGDRAPELRLDGTLLATGGATAAGAWYALKRTLHGPFSTEDYHMDDALQSGGTYVVGHIMAGASMPLITHRQRLLRQYLAQGQNPASEAVMGETLWLMALYWCYEEQQYRSLINRLSGMVDVAHGVTPLAGQATGYFFSIQGILGFYPAQDPNARRGLARITHSFVCSALEHGVLEQVQGSENPAVSTIKLLQISNSLGRWTFSALFGSWEDVRPRLKNYTKEQLDRIEFYINSSWHRYSYILPEDAVIPLQQWRGIGYIENQGGAIGMLISGGYNGGYSAKPNPPQPAKVQEKVPVQPAEKRSEGKKPPKSKDPVSLDSGAFVSAETDLTVGDAAPFGLAFTRVYNSTDSDQLYPLGYGWQHTYQMTIARYSRPDAGLGRRQAAEAAAQIVFVHVALQLLDGFPDPPSTVCGILAAQWAVDQLLDNVAVANIGGQLAEFVRLPDGSFIPPPGMVLSLRQTAEGYMLHDPAGLVYWFDASGKVTRWHDRNGMGLSFAYDADGRLRTVGNGLGCTFTFTYTGNLLTQVGDMGGRVVVYEYTNNNLTAVRDVLGNRWLYAYDAAHRLTKNFRPQASTQPVVTNVYDTFGRVQTQTDAYNNVTTFHWGGRCNAETNPDGSRVSHCFDTLGRHVLTIDAVGKRMVTTYDSKWRLQTFTDRLGGVTSMTYDPSSGLVASITNAAGNRATFTYTPVSQSLAGLAEATSVITLTFYELTQITYADGSSERFAYDGRGNLVRITDPHGAIWQYTYNSRGQPVSITNPTGGIVTLTYHSDGTLASSTDSDTGVSSYVHDAYKRLTRAIRPDGTEVSFVYDLADRILRATDERGEVATFVYDRNGNMASAIVPPGQAVTGTYDLIDRPTQRIDALGRVSTYAYDNMGRLRSVTDRNGNTMTFGYDLRGWLVSVTDPAGSVWRIGLDDESVPISMTTPMGYTTRYQTDALGRTTVVTNPLGAATFFTYDALNRLTAITDAMGRTTRYTYDAGGNMTSVVEPVIGTTVYTYNGIGTITGITDPRGKTWSFTYTPMGRLASQTDPLGNRQTYHYDNIGLINRIVHADSTTTPLAYNAVGQVTSVAHSSGPTRTYAYDAGGRLVRTEGLTLTYDIRGGIVASSDGTAVFAASYDNGQRLRTVTYAGQMTVTYTYDVRNLLTRVTDSRSGAWISFGYDRDGNLTAITRSNTVNTALTYDAAGGLTRIRDGQIADQQFVLNAEGEPIRATRALPYDPLPDITTPDVDLTYDDAGQISSPGYAYDQRGRQIAAPNRAFTYDGYGRLLSVTAGSASASFTYNGLGDLVSRTSQGSTTVYQHHHALAMAPIVAEKGDSSYKRFYVYAPTGELLYSVDATSGAVRFYHYDRVGSTLFLTDGSGAVSDAYAYDPYGRLLGQTGSSDQPFTYMGQYGVRRETVGNLYDMRARVYDPVTARFLTRDPLWPDVFDPQSLSPYQYAAQNPLLYVDPAGTNWVAAATYIVKTLWEKGAKMAKAVKAAKGAAKSTGKAVGTADSKGAFSSGGFWNWVAAGLWALVPGSAEINDLATGEFPLDQAAQHVAGGAVRDVVGTPATLTKLAAQYVQKLGGALGRHATRNSHVKGFWDVAGRIATFSLGAGMVVGGYIIEQPCTLVENVLTWVGEQAGSSIDWYGRLPEHMGLPNPVKGLAMIPAVVKGNHAQLNQQTYDSAGARAVRLLSGQEHPERNAAACQRDLSLPWYNLNRWSASLGTLIGNWLY